jgi:hypothetical protein
MSFNGGVPPPNGGNYVRLTKGGFAPQPQHNESITLA